MNRTSARFNTCFSLNQENLESQLSKPDIRSRVATKSLGSLETSPKPRDFKSPRHAALKPKDLRTILKKEIKLFTEIKFLYDELGECPYFRHFHQQHPQLYEKDSLLHLCKTAGYEKHEANSVIYSQGDNFNGKIYVVLSGKVGVSQEISSPKKISYPMGRSNTLPTLTLESFTQNSEIINNEIGEGGFFGDYEAPFRENRIATMVAEGVCEFIIIEQKEIQYTKENFRKINWNVLSFVQDYFPEMNKIQQHKLIHHIHLFEEINLSEGDSITTESQYGAYFYIIDKGECKVYKKWTRKFKLNTDFEIKVVQNFYHLTREVAEQVHFGTIKKGAFIGEEILSNDHSHYEYTVKVSSTQAKFYKVDKTKFVSVFPEETIDGIKKLYIKRKEVYEEDFVKQMDLSLREAYKDLQRRTYTQKHEYSPEKSKSGTTTPKTPFKDFNPLSIQRYVSSKLERSASEVYTSEGPRIKPKKFKAESPRIESGSDLLKSPRVETVSDLKRSPRLDTISDMKKSPRVETLSDMIETLPNSIQEKNINRGPVIRHRRTLSQNFVTTASPKGSPKKLLFKPTSPINKIAQTNSSSPIKPNFITSSEFMNTFASLLSPKQGNLPLLSMKQNSKNPGPKKVTATNFHEDQKKNMFTLSSRKLETRGDLVK